MRDLSVDANIPDDRQWVESLEASAQSPNSALPGFPSAELQTLWVGSVGPASIREVVPFYRLIKSRADFRIGPILDFGIGWGRVSRFFLNDVPSDQIYGVDVNSYILEECRRLKVRANLTHIDSFGTLPFPDGSFSVVYAYSVLTHLNKRGADHWAKEIARVLHPNGIFVPTLFTDDIFDQCRNLSTPDEMFGDLSSAENSYRDGEFVFAGYVNTLDENYGKAAIPISYIQKNWPFIISEYHRDLGFHQGACVLRRR